MLCTARDTHEGTVFEKSTQLPEMKMCRKRYKIPKNLFLEFSKVEFLLSFWFLNDDPNGYSPDICTINGTMDVPLMVHFL